MAAPENNERIARAFMAFMGGKYELGSLVDLLADLMHLAASENLDFDDQIRIARMHFLAESIDARKKRKRA